MILFRSAPFSTFIPTFFVFSDKNEIENAIQNQNEIGLSNILTFFVCPFFNLKISCIHKSGTSHFFNLGKEARQPQTLVVCRPSPTPSLLPKHLVGQPPPPIQLSRTPPRATRRPITTRCLRPPVPPCHSLPPSPPSCSQPPLPAINDKDEVAHVILHWRNSTFDLRASAEGWRCGHLGAEGQW